MQEAGAAHIQYVTNSRETVVSFRKWSVFLLWGAISVLVGCGGGTTANLQNPAAPAVTPVAIAFQPAPPTSVLINSSAPLIAVVANDSTNSGVDWLLSCQNPASCGSLSALHTASGQATTYLPSSTLSSNAQAVTISAFATADHSKNVRTSINVNAFASFLKSGTYIIETSGADPSFFPYQRVAAIVLDGKGGITSGEQTVNFMNPTTNQLSSVNDAVTGGSYVVGTDGRGTLTINTADRNIGQQGVETFSLVVLSSSQALLTKTDILNPNIPSSNESCVGTMDLQTPGAQVTTGGYALVVRGTDLTNSPIAYGGILNIDGPQRISGNGSRFDEVINGAGIVTVSSAVCGTGSAGACGTLSTPDKFGRFELNLNTNLGSPQVNVFTAYNIDGSHLKLIETDGSVGMTVGLAIGQGSLTGNFSTFSGNYTFGIFGQDLTGLTSSLASAGSFTAAGGSLTNGSIDEIQSGLFVQFSDGFTANYSVDPTGRVDTLNPEGTPSFTFATPSNGTGPELVFYLTGNGNPVLVLDADIEPLLNFGSGGGGVGTGLAYPATAGASFAGDYGFSFTQNFNGTETDSTAQICVNWNSVICSGGTPDTFSGAADLTIGFIPIPPPDPLTGAFQNSSVSGRLTGTLSDVNFYSNPLSMAFYLIDSSHGFFVETDGGATGTNQGYLTFGYFSARVPVCKGCP